MYTQEDDEKLKAILGVEDVIEYLKQKWRKEHEEKE